MGAQSRRGRLGRASRHDVDRGPRRVAGERIYRSRRFKDVRFVVGSLTVARKVASNSLADCVRSRYVLGVKTVFWLGSTVAKKHRRLLLAKLERLGRRVISGIQLSATVTRLELDPVLGIAQSVTS